MMNFFLKTSLKNRGGFKSTIHPPPSTFTIHLFY